MFKRPFRNHAVKIFQGKSVELPAVVTVVSVVAQNKDVSVRHWISFIVVKIVALAVFFGGQIRLGNKLEIFIAAVLYIQLAFYNLYTVSTERDGTLYDVLAVAVKINHHHVAVIGLCMLIDINVIPVKECAFHRFAVNVHSRIVG